MRITGGTLTNRRTDVPAGEVRPTMDRVRESVFAILGDLSGLSFLDLFSGSATCALEAFSRGAYPICIVEKDKKKIPVILKNISLADKAIDCKFIAAELFIQRNKIAFDIINIDPPYRYAYYDELLQNLVHSQTVKDGSIMLVQHANETRINAPEVLTHIDERMFGRTVVTFFKYNKNQTE